MSNANPEEVSMVVSEHGVTVEKSFEPDDFPVPAIAFVIRSAREEGVEVRIVDDVPGDVNATDIGFHPKYGAEYWSVDGDQIVFERSFEAGEEYTTVYGLRTEDPDDVERYLSEPGIEWVEPPLDDASAVIRDVIGGDESADDLTDESVDEPDYDADASDEVADEAADDEEPEPAIELVEADEEAGTESDTAEDEADTDDEADLVETLDLRDPGAASGDGGSDSGAAQIEADENDIDAVAEAEPNPPAAASQSETGNLAAALAAQLRAGEVSDDDLDTLRDALGVETEGPHESAGSLNAKITRLQTELADLAAYTDALEAFLDENGDAQTLLRELKTSIGTVQSELDALDDRSATTAAEVADVSHTVGRLDDTVTEVRETVETLESEVTAAEREAAAATAEVADVRDDLDGMRVHVDEVDEDIADLRGEVHDLEDDLTDFEPGGINELESRLAATQDRLDGTNARLDDLEGLDDQLDATHERLDEMDDRLDDLAAMRERLSSAFGAAAAPDPDDEGDYE